MVLHRAGGCSASWRRCCFCVPSRASPARRSSDAKPTRPPTPKPPTPFRLSHPYAKTYSFRDGDPRVEDAPQIVAVAGGVELWFQGLLPHRAEPPDLGRIDLPVVLVDQRRRLPLSVGAAANVRPLSRGIGSAEGSEPQATSIGYLREIYAEGDVYVTQGRRKVVQATKIYFNVLEDRSLIIGGEIRTNLGSLSFDPQNNQRNAQPGDRDGDSDEQANRRIPIVIRAAEIRGVANRLFEADDAQITTSTFAKPGYHVAMDRMVFEQRRDEIGGRLSGYNNRFILGETDVGSLDYLTIQTGNQQPLPLIGLGVGASSRFGAFIETRWGSGFQETGDAINRSLGIDGDFTGS